MVQLWLSFALLLGGRFVSGDVATVTNVSDKVVRCKQSCLGELVCTKTCDFLDQLDGNLGGKIQSCIQGCTSAHCTNECVFKTVGLSDAETKAYVTVEDTLSPCYKMANTAALSCVNKASCLQTDVACIETCSDQLENPEYVNCIAANTHTNPKDVDASNACRQSCLTNVKDLKDCYLCGVSCGGNYFKGLSIDTSKLNLTDTGSMSTNGSLKRSSASPSQPYTMGQGGQNSALRESASHSIAMLFILYELVTYLY